MKKMNSVFILSLLSVCLSINANAQQHPPKPASGKILQDLKKLNKLGNVLYLAAHPDDENTTLIAYLANQKLYHTGYLSLTRGDGGQNLIGPEIRERLGVIRTQELLQARRTDGGHQFFTRANDFGFSKNPEEVFSIWDREKLLADVVWVIRNFKPDVIITRFPKDSRAGHGQHSASSILAEDAFVAAPDPKRFPEQLKYVQPWQAKRLVWNISSWAFKDPAAFDKIASSLLKVDVGVFNPLLGKSYGEISAESRSMHKSQGFGSTGTRGSNFDYFQHTMGPAAKTDLFEDINTTWTRVPNSGKVQEAITKAIATYNAANPSAVVPLLLTARAELQKLPDSFWKNQKLEELQELIRSATGLYIEATAGNFAVVPGGKLEVQTEVINRSPIAVKITSIHFPYQKNDSTINTGLANSAGQKYKKQLLVPADLAFSQPYWLQKADTLGMFDILKQSDVGLPENTPAAEVAVNLTIGGQPFKFTVPVVYKHNDLVYGELYQPLSVSPPVFANIAENVYMFNGPDAKPVNVFLKAGKANIKGEVSLKLPEGWKVSPASIPFDIEKEKAEQTARFMVTPPANSNIAEIQAIVTLDNKTYNKGISVINYQHIPEQVLFPVALAKAVKLDLNVKGKRIGYLPGAGDEVPRSLQQIGYDVTLLKDGDINSENLEKFDAVIVGIRAYNTLDRINFYHDRLMDYVKNGGNVLIQYNTNAGLKTNPGPYPMKLSTDRVTVEGAEVRVLLPEHAAFQKPNKITNADFDGWVQERGLYFPSEWAKEYEALISINDPGESPKNSSILVAKYGKGNFVYTGISWFRQLPAGVPGAYRLFTNLISLGQ
ncbi:PIG-L family deacetylase [Pedobacter gandavensis]|uniref:PIG-L family deacetylase n=1 Tax=Pedobacter gandavensis TaxID=2679963 RepID=UPI00247A2FA9|nr:PIG-L family deacetylase [Pedobacter gandavensis]WGQ11323.1 PIG-L family deacetylase [Pedobacter gandavensis]